MSANLYTVSPLCTPCSGKQQLPFHNISQAKNNWKTQDVCVNEINCFTTIISQSISSRLSTKTACFENKTEECVWGEWRRQLQGLVGKRARDMAKTYPFSLLSSLFSPSSPFPSPNPQRQTKSGDSNPTSHSTAAAFQKAFPWQDSNRVVRERQWEWGSEAAGTEPAGKSFWDVGNPLGFSIAEGLFIKPIIDWSWLIQPQWLLHCITILSILAYYVTCMANTLLVSVEVWLVF